MAGLLQVFTGLTGLYRLEEEYILVYPAFPPHPVSFAGRLSPQVGEAFLV
jgi:hypothetical protein